MQHHRPMLRPVLADIARVEPLRQVEVELQCTELP